MTRLQHLIYIHGFNSSPKSFKARELARYLDALPAAERPCLLVPQLPYEPDAAITVLRNTLDPLAGQSIGLIGSSLGGYYGLWLAEHYQLPLALVNPAVYPYRLLADYLGVNTNPYSGEIYQFTEREVAQLKALEVTTLTKPERYFLLTQTGDEVLDYREGVAKFQGCRQCVQTGGDHSFIDFAQMIPAILQFLDEA